MLVQQGESAVIAMQFEISDPAAKAFAEELYYCLIDRRYPIDAAVAEARIAMLDVNQIEFATPVLFLRPGFVDLFNFKAPSVNEAPAVDAPPKAAVSAVASVGLPPPAPPDRAPPAVGTPPGPRKSKRWMVIAAGGVAAAVVGGVAVVTLSSGGDKAEPATTPPLVESESPVPTTISGDSYLTILHCVESDLFIEPYFDADSPNWSVLGIGQCDAARQQLEADGLDTEPMFSTIVDRMNEASALGALIDEGTDTPEDHQAFADNGAGLYDELRPMLRTLRGLDPSGGVVFATDLGDQVTDATDGSATIDYQTITDETGALTVDVPTDWTETDTAPLTVDKAAANGYAFALGDLAEAPWIKASPSIADLDSGYETPGIIFTALPPQSSLDETLAAFAPPSGACTADPIEDYSDGVYTGRFQSFTDCGGTGSMVVTVAAVPDDNSFTAVVAMQIVSDTDLDVLDQVIASFSVTS
jgi:hypothetical protein